MFSYEGFMRINTFFTGAYRIVYLNLLWFVTTIAGLVVFGFGPASYALASYIDGWFRRGDQPPMTRTFFASVRTEFWRSAATGWIILAAGAVIVTNVFASTSWYVQFANVIALFVLFVAAAYVFPVAVATDQIALHRRFGAALLIGFGSLHWTIIAAAASLGAVWLLYTFALPLAPFFGLVVPTTAIGLITRSVFSQLVEDDEHRTTSLTNSRQGIAS